MRLSINDSRRTRVKGDAYPHRSDQHQLEAAYRHAQPSQQVHGAEGVDGHGDGDKRLDCSHGLVESFRPSSPLATASCSRATANRSTKLVSAASATAAVIEPAFRGATAAGQTMIGYTGVVDNATLTGLANPGTVALLNTAILAKSVHVSDNHLKVAAAANLRLAAEPFFAMSPPTIGTVTTAVGGGAGGIDDGLAIRYILQAIDLNGRFTTASSEASVTTGTAGANDNVNTIPWTDVGGNFVVRVYAGDPAGGGAAGVYTHYKDVTDGASTTDATTARTGWTAEANTTATIAARAALATAGYGLVTDDMVDDARDAGSANFATLRNAISDQNSRGTAARTDDYATNSPFVP